MGPSRSASAREPRAAVGDRRRCLGVCGHLWRLLVSRAVSECAIDGVLFRPRWLLGAAPADGAFRARVDRCGRIARRAADWSSRSMTERTGSHGVTEQRRFLLRSFSVASLLRVNPLAPNAPFPMTGPLQP